MTKDDIETVYGMLLRGDPGPLLSSLISLINCTTPDKITRDNFDSMVISAFDKCLVAFPAKRRK